MKKDDWFDQLNAHLFRIGVYVLIWLIVLAWVLHSIPAQADDTTWLSVTVRSYHYQRKKDYNETWHGIGIEHGIAKDTRFVGGIYENSYGETSVYAGAAWMPIHLMQHLHLGAQAGCVNGYEKDPCSLFLIPALAYERKGWGVNLGVVPSTSDPYTVIGFQLKLKLR